MHILAIDDEPNVLLTLHEMLVVRGHTAVCVRSIERARDMLELDQFDAVIADTNLPLRHGGHLLEWIRLQYPTLPFLLIFAGATENVHHKHRADVLALGADLLFSKIAFLSNADKILPQRKQEAS